MLPADATGRTVAGGQAYLADIARRLAPSFGRSPSRDRVLAYVRGLLSEAERKHRGQVADVCGETTPYGCQSWLRRADGDANAVRDALDTSRVPQLGDPHGGLVLDDTGVLKKGSHSAGGARPYSGTAGQVDHGHIGVLLSDACPLGPVLLDRERYLPQAWTDARQRCRQAGIPEDRRLATTPQLAQQMLARAFAAGVPAPWVTGDRVDGHDRRLRMWLEARPQADVLAVAGQAYVWRDGHQRQVKTLGVALPEDGWTRLSAGDGAQGPRWSDWCWLPLPAPLEPGWCRWLRVRRRLSTPTALTASVSFAPRDTPLDEVVRAAGRRWSVERSVEAAKGEGGLDHEDVRSWTAWYRQITLAMWALALPTMMRAGTSAVDM